MNIQSISEFDTIGNLVNEYKFINNIITKLFNSKDKSITWRGEYGTTVSIAIPSRISDKLDLNESLIEVLSNYQDDIKSELLKVDPNFKFE